MVIVLFTQSMSFAQERDTSIVLETLKKGDLIVPSEDKRLEEFVIGRMDEASRDMPQKTYVITKRDIFQHDCITLVDVLKIIPGFRVSQPGSAQLGEIFGIRGFVGNSNMTILINGSPINPTSTPGMPIGAQLPIRQAERIEITVGPSIFYGTSSAAGVINIVISEIERPVEANSSISIGENGLRLINTTISGKSGKGKNLLGYSLFGVEYD